MISRNKGFLSLDFLVPVLGLVAAFLFVDWRRLLEQRKVRFNFHIWK